MKQETSKTSLGIKNESDPSNAWCLDKKIAPGHSSITKTVDNKLTRTHTRLVTNPNP